MRIIQLVHTLNYGDAISGEAITISRILTEQKITNAIYSVHAHEKVAQYCRNWQTLPADLQAAESNGEPVVLILHYSIASPLNKLFREISNVKRVLIYHNLTPVEWFQAYNSRVREDLEIGRDELRSLLSIPDLVVADSRFNKLELQRYGRFDVEVLPLLLDEQKWNIGANAGIRAALRGHGGKNILHVGRMAPNKCVEDIIKSFYFYHHKIERRSKLWLIGNDVDTEIYSFELRRLVTELRLKEAVEFVGAVADSELKAFYENADLYLCMSEHEGFCVPLLEAMYFGVPVIAYDACAVGETLGEAGILLGQKLPAETAELMNIVITDKSVREELQQRGRARATQFGLASFTEAFFKLIVQRVESRSLREQKHRVSNER